jgi:putative transcriptional regulator
MQYSRKGFWIFQAAAFGLVALLNVYVFWMGRGGMLPYISGAVLIAFGVLSVCAFFRLDEIQQAEHMRVWAHGSVLGALGAGLLIPFLQAQPDLLDAPADKLFWRRLHIAVRGASRRIGYRLPGDAAAARHMKNRIKVLRAEKNWSQAELAERINIARQSLNAIENAKADPSLPLGMRIARVFGVRVEDVFDLD